MIGNHAYGDRTSKSFHMLSTDLALVVFAYGLGCLNAGYYLLRWRDGRDLRELGSGNAGARNAGRILGRGGFALVFALDATKGLASVLVAHWWAPEAAAPCAIAAALGHVFPAQLDWRGGKGVATAIGGLAGLDMLVLTVATVAFVVLRLARARTTPAGLLALVCAATFALAFRPMTIGLAVLALVVLLTFTHRSRR